MCLKCCTKIPNDNGHIKLSVNNKAYIIHQSNMSYLYLAKYVSQTKYPEYLNKKIFPYMAKNKQGKTMQSFKF